MVFVVLFMQAVYAFGSVFVVCELCQRVSQAFNEVNGVFTEFDWIVFPKEVKRLIPISIIFAQQAIDVKFFGSLNCSRDSFKQVSSIDRFAPA